MVQLAVAATPGWEVSDLELRRTGKSYTFDTLATHHSEGFSPQQLFFITGADAFAEIATWYRYPEVLDAAHFVVISRPGRDLEQLRVELPELAARMTDAATAKTATTPQIVLIEADTPDVSSTDIRRRASRGESLAGLVPDAVAAYIAQHLLYSASVHQGR